MSRGKRHHKNKKHKKQGKKNLNMDTALDLAKDTANWEKLPSGAYKYIGKPATTGTIVGVNDDDGVDDWRRRHGLSTGGKGGYSHGGYAHGGGYTSYVSDKHNCSHTPNIGCKVGDITLYPTADKFITAETIKQFDVVMPLVDSGFNIATTVDHYMGLLMWFPIKDFSAPDATKLLIHARRVLDFAKGGARVAFYCLGSHGRTGTVLATCIGLAEPDVDPIAETRARHCKHCVETQAQIECVFRALGREVPEKYRSKSPPNANPIGFTTQGWKEGTAPVTADNHWSIGCAFCSEKDPMKGCYPLFVLNNVQQYAHITCYNGAKADLEKKQAAQKSEASGATPNVMTKGDTKPEQIDHTAYKALLDSSRPFQAKWPAGDLAMIDGAINDVDTWDDLICPKCNRLIIDPNKMTVKVVPSIMGAVEVEHTNCDDAKENPEATVLCKLCCENDVTDNIRDQICTVCAKDGN